MKHRISGSSALALVLLLIPAAFAGQSPLKMSDKLPACRCFREGPTHEALDKLAACRTSRVALFIISGRRTATWATLLFDLQKSGQAFTANSSQSSGQAPVPAPRPQTLHKIGKETRRRVEREIEESAKKRERYDQPDEAAEFYRLKRAPEGETQIPVERYFAAREQMREMPRYSTARRSLLPSETEARPRGTEEAALGEWTPLGPGNIGGRTRAIVINPQEPSVMYAAGVAGGVWKTANGGASWSPLTDFLPNLSVSALAIDQANPKVVYAGTGEGFFNSDAARGAGILKTIDGGATWTRLESTTNPDFHYVNDIVISPTDNQRLYAATRTGVWRSRDGGETWTRTLEVRFVGGCLDLAARSDQGRDLVFAACGSFTQGIIYRNTDAAAANDWVAVLFDPGMGRASLAIAPSDPNVIYAATVSIASGETIQRFQSGLHAVFRSTSNGDAGTWTAQTRNTSPVKLNTVLFSNPLLAFLGECGLAPSVFANQGWYDNVIAVDPADANRVWVGGIDLFRSDDGGANWGLASYWWADKSDPHYAHADHHAIVFHPQYNGASNKTMFIGTDGGIFRTDDARAPVATSANAACNPNATGVAWTSLNNGYGVTQFYHGAVFPDGKTYFGGTQDNGTLIGADASGVNGWRELFGGDGGYVAVNPNDPNQVYLETTGLSLRKSTDGGRTFGAARIGIDESPYNFLFITPFLMDPSDPQRLFIGGSSLWITENGAANWRKVPGSRFYRLATAIAVAPTDSNFLLVGDFTGSIYHTRQGLILALPSEGSSIWSSGTPRSGFVSSLTYDPKDRNIAYATYSTFGGAHVWKSVNAGISWAELDGAGVNRLPDIPVHSLVVDPDNTSRLYIGTDLGVFTSADGGANWMVENTGFPNTVVESLFINTARGARSLYAFTHGRGVWRVALGSTQCNYTLSATRQVVSGAYGSSSVDIKAPAGCAWTASSNANWIGIPDLESVSGSGDGTVKFTFNQNSDLNTRVGTIAIAGKSFTVIQPPSAIIDTTPLKLTIIGYELSFGVSANLAMTVRGKVEDDVGAKRINWQTDRGLSGYFDLFPYPASKDWLFYLPAPRGLTKLTVTGEDFGGNIASATTTLRYEPEYLITTAGGTLDSGYGGDGGPLANALFAGVTALAFDKQGNLYIADAYNNRIRKVAADSRIITTIAGTGEANYTGDGGPAAAAKISNPRGIAFDAAGNLYFSDTFNHRIRRVDVRTGVITTVAGSGQIPPFGNGGGFSGDGGPATSAMLKQPTSIVVDQAGNIIFSDSLNYRIRKIDAATGIISTLFTNAGIAVALDNSGNLYFTEALGARLRKVTPNGQNTVIAGTGQEGYTGDGGPATAAAISAVGGITVDSSGNIYFTSFGSHTVRKISAQSGIITTIAGGAAIAPPQGENVPGPEASLVSPFAIALDSTGNVFFSEASKIRKLTPLNDSESVPPTISIAQPTTASSFATVNATIKLTGAASDNVKIANVSWTNDRGGFGVATGTTGWTIDSIPLQLGVNKITVTAWDQFGNKANATLNVTYDPGLYVTRIAGAGARGFDNDGGAATSAQLFSPESASFDAAGNLYIADAGNHRIRKITRDGVITTFAGSGQIGGAGDGGLATAAELNAPSAIVFDAAGVAYIADTNNHRIRRVTPDGKINAFAGTGKDDFGGDGGPAIEAHLDTPAGLAIGLAIDGAGNLLIADAGNNRVRKVDLRTGVITTAAGAGYGDSPDGVAASEVLMFFPTAIAFDRAGNLLIADTGNNRIRKVSATGAVSVVAGAGAAGFNGDGIAAKNARLNAPGGLAIDARGVIYFADQANHRVRMITPDGTISTVAGTGQAGADEGGLAAATRLNTPSGVTLDAAGKLLITDTGNHRVIAVSMLSSLANVSAASFIGPVAANEAIIAAFGINLSESVEAASSLPLPTTLAGTTVKVRDSAGNERLAPLFFVSPSQVNYQIPPGAAAGAATVTITNSGGVSSASTIFVAPTSPGLFSANASGQGVAAAVALRIKADGSQIYEPVAIFDQSQNKFVARPIDLGPSTDQVFLILFGTGARNRSSLSGASAQIGGVNAEVLFVGPQGGFVGLDQVNLRLPRGLAGRGDVEVALTVDGKTANSVKINVK